MAAGFPLRRVGVYEQRALAAGVAVVQVTEISPSRREGCRRRQVSRVVLPSSG